MPRKKGSTSTSFVICVTRFHQENKLLSELWQNLSSLRQSYLFEVSRIKRFRKKYPQVKKDSPVRKTWKPVHVNYNRSNTSSSSLLIDDIMSSKVSSKLNADADPYIWLNNPSVTTTVTESVLEELPPLKPAEKTNPELAS